MMEQEVFRSGYCRRLDSGRTVEIILENGRIMEADCDYPDCKFRGSCPIAKEIDALAKQ